MLEQGSNAAATPASADATSAAVSSSSSSSAGSPSALTRGRWSDVADLVSHLEQADPAWSSVIDSAMKLLIAEYKTLQQQPQQDSKPSVFDGLRLPDLQTLCCLCARINNNAHALFDNYSSSNRTIGLGLFPITSILNHSCAPNAIFSPSECGRMMVRALRPIKSGEEITVPYVDLFQNRAEKQRELQQDKHFVCACQRCRIEQSWRPIWPPSNGLLRLLLSKLM